MDESPFTIRISKGVLHLTCPIVDLVPWLLTSKKSANKKTTKKEDALMPDLGYAVKDTA